MFLHCIGDRPKKKCDESPSIYFDSAGFYADDKETVRRCVQVTLSVLRRIAKPKRLLIFVPTTRDGSAVDADERTEWEGEFRDWSHAIGVWMMPEFVIPHASPTDTLYRTYMHEQKLALGYPQAAKFTYLEILARQYRAPVFRDMDELLASTVALAQQRFAAGKHAGLS